MSLKDIFSELNDIPNLTQEQKKTLVSIFSCEDTSNAVYKILMGDNHINSHLMSGIGLGEDILNKVKVFFEQDFYDKKDFFVSLKKFFDEGFLNTTSTIYLSDIDFKSTKIISDDRNNGLNTNLVNNEFFDNFKSIENFNIDLKNNQALYSIKTVYGIITFVFSNNNPNSNLDIENEFLKIRKLFRRQLLSTKIVQTCKYIDGTFSDFLTGTLKVDYLSKVNDNKKYSVIYLDIDDFKHINDTYGHKQGDLYLKKFSDILKKSVRDTDKIVRYGGDEFVILVDTKNLDELDIIVRRIKENILYSSIEFVQPKSGIIDKEFFSSSIGYALFNEGLNISELINNADLEMYERKKLKSKPNIRIPKVNKEVVDVLKQ